MPHIRIEYSANLRTRVDWRKLMHDLHPVLAKAAATVVENCKSRAIERDLFHVGTVEGSEDRGFVHLDIGILPGRTPEIKDHIGKQILSEVLEKHLREVKNKQDVQVTVEIHDMNPYFKLQ